MLLSSKQKEILIASVDPYFLEKGDIWYGENFQKIRELSRNQVWWRENTIFLEKDQQIKLFELLRRLTELGYERVQTIGAKGEFSQRGGILDISPINSPKAFRLEFSGNRLSEIYDLAIKELKTEKDIKKALAGRAQSLLSTLKSGEYVVHLDHGIGIFQGYARSPDGEVKTQTPTPESPERFFVIEYAKNDRLYIPLKLEEKLSRYIGFETPIIHRLGGTIWFKTKRKVKESTFELARNLLALYSQRAAQRGFRFPTDDEFQKELEDSFEYIETEDQLKAIGDVKKDMESEKPMDRLICGDVGFGKTEVALRAAFKAAAAGKQVAILTPTTILAHQHFRTFKKRLAKFPINISLLSRLESKKEQQEILGKLKEGKIDIIIGTHRIIQKDVGFKDLGLAIIDEEQRFGVKQKEKFKEWRKDIDILSLSATPIPRTLNLALSGLRDITLIQTAPPGRLPVKTFIHPLSDKIIKNAIEKELERGGQVYYLHNRVQTIGLAARKIEALVKSAKVGIAHGRLTEKQIVGAMDDFETGKINILVATTIIENGLDFPHVNTLVVANAARLGLAQSYQLRGRIGRSNIQANAYFLYNAKKMGQKAEMRLEALQEAGGLGAGYQIALRDLEIRGSGNVLGREQSGQINAIGLNLYMQMLSESVEELK